LGPEFLADLSNPAPAIDPPALETPSQPARAEMVPQDTWSFLSGLSVVTVIVALALYPILRGGGESLTRLGRPLPFPRDDDFGDE
jgi:hypothetical protein